MDPPMAVTHRYFFCGLQNDNNILVDASLNGERDLVLDLIFLGNDLSLLLLKVYYI